MVSVASISICSSIFLAFIQIAQGQAAAGCKCGGTYANGKAVAGCVNGQCAANATASTRCVIIYREKTPIGFDCVAWPAHVADCATFDDGSRVCANAVCRPTLLAGEKGDCAMESDDASHTVLAAQVSKNGLNFAMDAIKRQVELEVAKVKIPNQKVQQSGFDVTVTDIKISDFVSPVFSYVLLPPSSVKIVVKGGDFKVCAKWDAKKAFINPGGDICVWSENHKGVEVEVTAKVTVNEKNQLRLATSDCKLHVPIDMKLTGVIGSMINVVSSFIENAVQNQASTQVCKLLDNAVKTTVTAMLDTLPTHIKIDDRYGVAYGFRSVTVSDNGVRAQFAANGTFVPKSR